MGDGHDIVAAIEAAGWQQGDLIGPGDAGQVLDHSEDRRPETADPIWLIVLSQDCDLRRNPVVEPWVEVIAARECPPEELDKACLNGRQGRNLHLRASHGDTGLGLCCLIHDRCRIPKPILPTIAAGPIKGLEAEAQRILRQWVARRYTRRPFANSFEKRLKHTDSKSPMGKFLKRHDVCDLISTIQLAVDRAELPEAQAYEIQAVLTVEKYLLDHPANHEHFAAIERAFEDAIEATAGVAHVPPVDAEGDAMPLIRSEDDLTMADLRRFQRLEADYRSSGDNARPSDGLDSE
jgi:hypothetical protein